MNQELDPQQAIRDLELIRSILSTSGEQSELRAKGNTRAWQSQLIVHLGTLAVVLGLIMIEIVFENINTQFLLASRISPVILQLGIFNLSLMLLVGLVALYYVAFWAARTSELNIQDYLKHHFTYLRNFSFIADLLVKYVTFSLLLSAQRPEWIAPLLTLFIADYLFQRRFFVLPVRSGMFLGVLCLLVSCAQFINQSPLLLWSLVVFLIAGMASLLNILSMQRRDARE